MEVSGDHPGVNAGKALKALLGRDRRVVGVGVSGVGLTVGLPGVMNDVGGAG